MKKTVLILGGTRFIGRYILELLNNDIFDVYYFHRGKTCFEPKVSSVEILGNRTNEDDVQQLFKQNFDVVIDISGERYEMVRYQFNMLNKINHTIYLLVLHRYTVSQRRLIMKVIPWI